MTADPAPQAPASVPLSEPGPPALAFRCPITVRHAPLGRLMLVNVAGEPVALPRLFLHGLTLVSRAGTRVARSRRCPPAGSTSRASVETAAS